MAAEADSDSEDENFLGFTEGDIVDGDSDSGDELSITIHHNNKWITCKCYLVCRLEGKDTVNITNILL